MNVCTIRSGETRQDPRPFVALYVHVPFCRARCAYCDFNTYAGLEDLIPAYVTGLRREIRAAGEHWGSLRISTIYVGGGTPSLLSLNLLADIMDVVQAEFDLSECVETTLEANPGSVPESYLSGLRSLGVDRLSLGVQSADDDELQMLGRIHGWSDAVRAVGYARRARIENVSLDLLFGLPGQSLAAWERTLRSALSLGPDHLSLYGLTVEKGTPLARRIESQELPIPDEDRAAAMYELAEEMLAKAGFFHYEISNWARLEHRFQTEDCRWWPGGSVLDPESDASEALSPFVCRHNLTYWRNNPWLGVGAGAYSWMPTSLLDDISRAPGGSVTGKRCANVDHPAEYAALATEASYPDDWRKDIEKIDPQLEMGESMMLGLRLAEGVTANRFEDRFRVPLTDVFGRELLALRELGLVTWDGAVARLTTRGRLLGNYVFERFI